MLTLSEVEKENYIEGSLEPVQCQLHCELEFLRGTKYRDYKSENLID